MSKTLILELPGNFRALVADMVREEHSCNDLSPAQMENEISKRMEEVAARMMEWKDRNGVRIWADYAVADIGTKVPS